MSATDQHTAAILRGMGLDSPDVSGPSKMKAVAAMTEELVRGMWRAVHTGALDRSRIAAFNAGTWPSPKQLEAKVREISAKADREVAA